MNAKGGKNNVNSAILRLSQEFPEPQKGWQLIATHQQRMQPWIARELRDSELKPLNALNCSQESSIRSESYEIPTYIRFNNTTARPVVIYWLNYEGQRDPTEHQRVTIGPGQSGFRVTYVTHPFLVADESGKCLAIYQPAREPSLAVIR